MVSWGETQKQAVRLIVSPVGAVMRGGALVERRVRLLDERLECGFGGEASMRRGRERMR